MSDKPTESHNRRLGGTNKHHSFAKQMRTYMGVGVEGQTALLPNAALPSKLQPTGRHESSYGS